MHIDSSKSIPSDESAASKAKEIMSKDYRHLSCYDLTRQIGNLYRALCANGTVHAPFQNEAFNNKITKAIDARVALREQNGCDPIYASLANMFPGPRMAPSQDIICGINNYRATVLAEKKEL